jgi:FkbM family methyltransferase
MNRERTDPSTVRLPNGLEVAYQSRVELDHFYEDIFEKEIYASHGLHLTDDSCVFDVGGNIGLFTLFVQTRWPGSRVFTFEPAPPLFEILRWNARRYAPRSQLFNCGVSNAPGEAELTFYPKSSGMSSFYADKGEERAVLEAVLRNEAREGVAAAQGLMEHLDDYLEDRLETQPFTCPLVPLSEIIDAHQVETIDLVKIDVQKSELAVLEGLRDEDWPRVQQIVIEVHDHEGRVELIRHLLSERGFEIQVVQDDHYEGSDMFNLYALRPREEVAPKSVPTTARTTTVLDRANRQKAAWKRPLGRRRGTGRRK